MENNNESEAASDLRKTSLGSVRPNIKELTNKQRNWFSSFEKQRAPSTTSTNGVPDSGDPAKPEPIDSARRTSVKNEPNLMAGGGVTTATPPKIGAGSPSGSGPVSLPPDATPTPPSNLNLPRDRRPLSARGSGNSDSIEDYLRNWKKTDEGNSPSGGPSPCPSNTSSSHSHDHSGSG